VRSASARAALSLGVALILLLSGCVPSWVTEADRSTPTGEQVEPDLQPYYSQVLQWRRCDNGAQCATAIAPLDWNDPAAGEDVELALVRHRATGEARGSLFVNPGGPGASGVDFVRDSVDSAVSPRLRASFDIVGWDPRGVGQSSAVSCYSSPADMDDFLFGIPEAESGSAEWIDEITESAQRFIDACVENSGELLEHVDTESTVRDLDLLRALVGDAALNFFGYSYGTKIGARYADRFPERVGRMVLDGAIDPTVSQFDAVLAQSIGFERALTTYLSSCTVAASCPFPADLDAALAVVRRLYERLETDPLPAADGRAFSSSVLDIAIATALYDEGTWPFLSQMFTELRVGNVETGFLLADFYYGREGGQYRSNSLEAFIAINCLDYPVERDPTVIIEQNEQLVAAAPVTTVPSPVGDILCQNWPFGFGGDLAPVRAEGAPPILVIGTTGDPATPYHWAQALAEQLASGILLTFDGEGHIAYDEGVACVNDVVDDFFLTGALPAADPVCRR
jgi:pimeloyl-ACP methyl ester carboxylesterase